MWLDFAQSPVSIFAALYYFEIWTYNFTLYFAGRKHQIDVWGFWTKCNIMAIMTIFKLLHNIFP